jgi:hypothetical protein
LKEWNASPEKAGWLKSDNYQVFSRSKLALRLEQARDEFAAVAGFPPGMATLDNVAGGESALAIYDIGQMHFVFATRLGAGRTLPAALTKARPAYQARKAGAVDYYVATAKDTGRVAAYGMAGNLLVLGTREDLVAGALRLAAAPQGLTPVAREPWFERTAKAAQGQAGEIRMVGNLEVLGRSPHFRSYWVQQNITELKQFSSFVSDIYRTAGEIREERVLLRVEPGAAGSGAAAAVAQLLPLVPGNAGFYRASADATAQGATALLAEKVLAPRSELQPRIEPAAGQEQQGEQGERPAVAVDNAALEQRIDEAPVRASAAAVEFAGLARVLEANGVEAVLTVEGAQALPDGVFVAVRSAVAVLGKSNWDEAAMRRQMAATLGPVFPGGGSALHPVEVAVRGRTLVVANDAALMKSMLANPGAVGAAAANAVYAAGYRHSRELPLFARMTRMIDAPQRQGRAPNEERQPLFFSENMASLGQSARRLESATMTVRDTGATLPQTVVYRFATGTAAAR